MPKKKEDRKTHADTLIPKPHIRQADFVGVEPVLTVKGWGEVTVHDKRKKRDVTKGILTFETTEKYLIMNETRKNEIIELHGEFLEDWIGKKIRLYITKVDAFGDELDAIRIKAPPTVQENIQALGFPEEPKKQAWKEGHIQIVLEGTYYETFEDAVALLNESGLDPNKVSEASVKKFAKYFQGEIDAGKKREEILIF